MAKFKVGDIETQKTIIQRKQIRTSDDLVTTIEVEKVVDINPSGYGHENLQAGDVIEIKGRLAEKAKANPMFTEIRDKDIEAKQPNAKRTFNAAARGSDEWLEQRVQYRRI